MREQPQRDGEVPPPGELSVFVYGTLMPGGRAWAARCAGRVAAKRRARVRGRLFALAAGYPALVPVAEPDAPWVQGWLLELRDAAALRGFDEWENHDPARPAAENEYQRVRVPVFEPRGKSARPRRLGLAWVYAMDPARLAACGATAVSSGRWRDAG